MYKVIEVHLAVKRNKKILTIEWTIVRKQFFDAKSNYCVLCVREIYFIINYLHEDTLLSKQSELINKCTRENKNILANIGISGKKNNDRMD